jgi:hypothetical protein
MTRRQLVARAAAALVLVAVATVPAACGPDSAQIDGESPTQDGSPPP